MKSDFLGILSLCVWW